MIKPMHSSFDAYLTPQRETPGEAPIPASSARRDALASAEQRVAAVTARSHADGLRATVIVAAGLYFLALGGSLVSGVRAAILDGVPFCLLAAAFLCFYGDRFFPRGRTLVRILEAALIVVALGLSLACLSYVGEVSGLTLRDQQIIWVDRRLGFDWLGLMHTLDHWPRIMRVLNTAYASFTPQLLFTVLVLAVARRPRELDRFFIIFVGASLITEIASFLIPTLGPMLALADHVRFDNLPTIGRTTAHIVMALREGSMKTIDYKAVDGIISFPSLHAAVAVIVPYALRWNRPLFLSICALDSLMLISAIPSGNHYLADVLAGVAVAVLVIGFDRYVHETNAFKKPPPLQRPGLLPYPLASAQGPYSKAFTGPEPREPH
jgi:membrane-associated phospholipid phosphatase